MIVTKKAISPVVATALLLVVAVVALVSFQAWYGEYSSGLLVDVENSDDEVGDTRIEVMEGDVLYFKADGAINITGVRIEGTDCGTASNGVYTDEVAQLNVTNCTSSLVRGSFEAVVITQSGVFSKELFFNN